MTTDTQPDAEQGRSDAAAPSPVRYPTAIALGGGLAAAAGSSFIPMNAIEGFVSAYGIAELLPAAAPPLGTTARLALSAGIGTLTAGALLALLPRGETDDMGYETAVTPDAASDDMNQGQAATASGFGATRLAGWLRTLRFGKSEPAEGEISDFSELSRLRVRMGDQHPDAPVRAPIMASSDLGAPLDPTPPARVTEAQPLALDAEMALAQPEPLAQSPSMRFAPPVEAPMEMPVAAPVQAPMAAPMPAEASEKPYPLVVEETQPFAAEEATHSSDLASLGIAALLDRLETGLVRRRTQAQELAAAQADATPARRIVPLALASATAEEDAPSPMRFNLGLHSAEKVDQVAEDNDVEPVTWPADVGVWEEPTEYHQPMVPEADAATIEQEDEQPLSDAATPAAEDDMDAALRDALATLRQLSDRQRNL
ncbi:hypothetical protein [Blastomonas sp.]|uniref:hypothetical protein n=1 Tax=Blastomonas sp. TaxID=1909299 RepID=UPI00391B4285